jgi:hypothetical protein
MTQPQCPDEHGVITAILAGRWPDQCDETLQAHAAQCEVCGELVEVVSLLRVDRKQLHDEMRVPSAGQIWWRAAIRARLEASQQVARPLSWVFGVLVACVAGLALAVAELLWSPIQSALRSTTASGWTTSFGISEITGWLPSMSDLTPLATTGVLVVLGAAACLVLAPIALYFALSDE